MSDVDYGTGHTFSFGFHYEPGCIDGLRGVLKVLRYKPGWEFEIMGQGGGLRLLRIRVPTIHSWDLSPFLLDHTMPIPPVPYGVEEWERWVLDMILLVERHEACEFFEVGDERPFYPEHGQNAQPYKITRSKDS